MITAGELGIPPGAAVIPGTHLVVSYLRPRHFAPDRVRSFLQYLQEFEGPFRLIGLPSNLYAASEKLTNDCGRLQPNPIMEINHKQITVTIEIRCSESGHSLVLDLGRITESVAAFTSPRFLELFMAGARMTSAEYAMASLEPTLSLAGNLRVDHGRIVIDRPPLALWLSPRMSEDGRAIRGMTIVHEEWDGAILLLSRPVPETHSSRQAIRIMTASDSIGAEALTLALREALSSSDWEVRASAMLGAARHHLQSLGLSVKRMNIPEKGPGGVTGDVRKMLLAMQKASLLLLSGTQPRDIADEARDTRVGMQAHLLRCIAGLPVSFNDDFCLLTTALTQPLPLNPPRPQNIPEGLQPVEDGSFRNVHAGAEFVWVPPVAHWLGAGESVRQRVPDRGFFLSKVPLESATGGTVLVGFDQIERLCAESSARQCLSLALPAADEWEMAARGPDGRLFPWGNGWDKDALNAISPWGVRGCVIAGGQWTEEGLRCGDARDPRCAARFSEQSPAAIRWKIVHSMSS